LQDEEYIDGPAADSTWNNLTHVDTHEEDTHVETAVSSLGEMEERRQAIETFSINADDGPLAHDPSVLESGIPIDVQEFDKSFASAFADPNEQDEGADKDHAQNIAAGRAELERRQRGVEYQRKTAQFIENFMLDYPGQEPPDFWDPYNNVKEYILHDQTKKRGIFQSHELYGKDDLTSEHSEFARRYDEDWYAQGQKKGEIPTRYYSSIDKVRYRVCIPSLNKKGVPASIPTMDLEGTSGGSRPVKGRRQSLVEILRPGRRTSAAIGEDGDELEAEDGYDDGY